MVISGAIVSEEYHRGRQASEDEIENVLELQTEAEQDRDQQKNAGWLCKKRHTECESGERRPAVPFSGEQRRKDSGERPEHRNGVAHRLRGHKNERGTPGEHYCASH